MSVLETLEICFTANLSPVTAQLNGLAGQLRGLSGQTKAAGYQFSAGFASGIRSGRSVITSAVSSVVNSAMSRMRSLLAIHSPSKVTQGIGGYFGEGFAKGIAGSAALVSGAAQGLGASALVGLNAASLPEAASQDVSALVQSAVDRALGGVQLTVPLMVDGMKLGEASIRGINAVTKSAGRVLLNI